MSQAQPQPTITATGEPISPKSRTVAAILAWFLGIFGIHRFYVGKTGTGVLMIVTLGGVGIWALIDFVMIVVGSFRDSEGRVLANWS
jgi:TM2 domain-containing membrane protein YozV